MLYFNLVWVKKTMFLFQIQNHRRLTESEDICVAASRPLAYKNHYKEEQQW